MKNFFVITNEYKDKGFIFTKQIQNYIQQKGGTCITMEENQQNIDFLLEQITIPKTVECILVLGGDGTMIRAARDASNHDLPMIGVNLGHLGYLCELEEKNVFLAIDHIMQEQCVIEERMMLHGMAIVQHKTVKKKSALNDIVIFRKGSLQVIEIIVSVNGEFLYRFRGDGMIVSTPTGSTGYSMSAGGPILDPKAKMIVLTPINAHDLNSKSIVLSAQDTISIELGTRRQHMDEQAEVSFDGDEAISLNVGDKIVIYQSKRKTKILKLSKISFLEILRKKMQIYS